MGFRRLSTRVVPCLLILVLLPRVRAAEVERDVLVYGGTAAGVMAGIAAARHGASVIVLEPGQHVGGMVSGGLSRSDVLRQEHLIGGLGLEFFKRVGQHYGRPVAFQFEPHVAEDAFNGMLKEQGVEVRFGQSLDEAQMDGARVRGLRTRRGDTYTAKVFIDATYEGDLLKAAGVSYAVGREGRDRYNESLAGRCELLPTHHQFKAAVSPWRDGELLPHITPQDKLVPVGAGDGKIQGYCFRLCLTHRPENRLPIPKPEGYDQTRYELLRRYILAFTEGEGERMPHVLGIGLIPNGKCDVNSGGPVSTNLLGANQEYPEASPERRAQIREEHRSWAHGLLYFLQNDPSVPERFAPSTRHGVCAGMSFRTRAAGRISSTCAKLGAWRANTCSRSVTFRRTGASTT